VSFDERCDEDDGLLMYTYTPGTRTWAFSHASVRIPRGTFCILAILAYLIWHGDARYTSTLNTFQASSLYTSIFNLHQPT
jgi:hypothetical protein